MPHHTITPDPHEVVPEVLEVEHRPPPIPKGWLYAMIVAMIMMWSCNFIIGKIAVSEFPAVALSGIRVQTAALILLALFFARRGPAAFAPMRANWKLMTLLALFGVVLNQGFFVVGLKLTSVAHSSLIVSLGPVFVLILARLHGLEELTWMKVAGLALSLAGLGLLVAERHPGQQSSLLGDFFIATGSLAFAYYVILSKEITPRFDSLSLNTFVFLLAAIMMIPLSATAFFGGGLSHVTWRGWLAMLYMAAFASVTAYLIFYYALHYISATRISALSYLQPPIATFLSWMFLRERITPALVAGAVVIFVGVYITEKG